MKTNVKFQHLLLLLAFVTLVACQPKNNETQTAEGVAPPSTNIYEAAFMGNTKAIEQHIAAGTDLNAKDEYGSTPLNVAITFNQPEIALLLIEAGVDLDVRSADGSTPLHTASFFGRTEIVRALLEAGADTRATNNYDATPLVALEAPFEQVKPIYDQVSKDLGPMGFKLDYQQLQKVRPEMVQLIKSYQ